MVGVPPWRPFFLLAALALAMLPGPATALLIREAARGVAALVAAGTLAYAVLRAVGATVLVVLGIQTLWYARRGATGGVPGPVDEPG